MHGNAPLSLQGGASHYDEIAATSNAWGMILLVVREMLGMESENRLYQYK